MSKEFEPTPEQIAGWQEWVGSRPDAVRNVAERFYPWKLYRLKQTGQFVSVLSFGQNVDGRVTLTVLIKPDFNPLLFVEREVFGIEPDDLEPYEQGEV